MNINQDLDHLREAAAANEAENDRFKSYLRTLDAGELDERVHRLNAAVTPQVDCTACGNCCKTLMINVAPGEIEPVAARLQKAPREVMDVYVETSLQGHMILNTIPCPFLTGTMCSIYEDRFNECREFPSLHQPGFSTRLFPTFMHYGRCPIVYNVVEELKQELGFS